MGRDGSPLCLDFVRASSWSADRSAELLDQEVHLHAAIREELRVVEERHVAAYKLLQERKDSEVSLRDETIAERDDEIVRLGRLITEQMARLEEVEKTKYDEIEALKEP